MKITAIILARSENDYFKVMTQNCINSLLSADRDFEFDVHVVESSNNAVEYFGASVWSLDGDFGYNKAINFGYKKAAEVGLGEYVILANNDLVFKPCWLRTVITRMNRWSIDSACPENPGWQPHLEIKSRHPGWEAIGNWDIGVGFCGWIQVYRKAAIEHIMPFNEEIKFWCADNYAAWRGQKAGHVHALICDAHVEHLTSASHSLIPQGLLHEWTHGQSEVFGRVIREEDA